MKYLFILSDVFIPMPENLLVNLNERKEVRHIFLSNMFNWNVEGIYFWNELKVKFCFSVTFLRRVAFYTLLLIFIRTAALEFALEPIAFKSNVAS